MAHPSATTSSTSKDTTYLSEIITGQHGDQYQMDLTLALFERATRKGYDFQLGYEMAIADKFDDVAFFHTTKDEWILIQTKHTDTSKGKLPPLKFDLLLPSDDGTRDKGDFSLFKYLKSYMTVQANIKARTKVIIFTNREFSEKSYEEIAVVEPRKVDEIFDFTKGNHVGLKVEQPLVEKMLNYVNRDFNSLKDGIEKLFNEGIMTQAVKDFKTPLLNLLTKTGTGMTLPKTPASSEAEPLLAALRETIDFETALAPHDICKELFTGRSRNKTLPLSTNEDTVRQFFEDLILSVAQPSKLRGTVDQDLRLWLRDWIHPKYFTRLEEAQLEITKTLETTFNAKRSQVEAPKNDCKSTKPDSKAKTKSHVDEANANCCLKNFVTLNDGKEFFKSVKENLEKQIRNLSNFNADNESKNYISRQIESINDKNGGSKITITDSEFFHELSGKLANQRFLYLKDEPGMGKSTVLEVIALDAQRKSSDFVYIFHLNALHHKLEENNDPSTLLSVLEPVLSEANYTNLQQTINAKDKSKKYFIIFDAFDEVFPKNREKVLKIFRLLLTAPTVTLLVSARRTVKTLVEDKFTVKVLSLVPLTDQEQTRYLKLFWDISEQNDHIFRKYVDHLFKIFNSKINRAICKFIGLPLMLKMLAEVYSDHFQEYLQSNPDYTDLEKLMPKEKFSSISLYEQFVRKSFANKMRKKFLDLYLSNYEEYDWVLFETFTLEHQLLAIKQLQMDFLETVFQEGKQAKILEKFRARITNGSEKSPLVEAVDNDSRIIHLSYAEFLVAQFILQNIERYEVKIFGEDSKPDWFVVYPMVMRFFFTMVEGQYRPNHLKILERHCKKNSRIALWACECAAPNTVEYLLRTKCDSMILDWLLNLAAKYNRYNICTYLLRKRLVVVDCRIKRWEGKTLLEMASKSGYSKIVKILVDNSEKVNAKNKNGWTPLHFAAQSGHCDVIQYLIDHYANVNVTNNYGWTPLHIAAQSGQLEAVKIFTEHPENLIAKDSVGRTAIHRATQNGHLKIVKYLVDRSWDVNEEDKLNCTALHIAAEIGHFELVNILIKHSHNVDAKSSYQLWRQYDLVNGEIEVVGVQTDFHYDSKILKNINWTALHIAALGGHTKVVEILVNQFANVNARTKHAWTPLHYAAQNDNLEATKILIDHLGKVNAKNYFGWTPLHCAANKGHTEIVKHLIDHCGNVNTKTKDGWTPLHFAVMNGHLEVVKLLVDNFANVDAKNNVGWTALHSAAQNGHSKIANILIGSTGDVNSKENNSWTPLHLAVKNSHVEVAKLLVDNLGDVNAANYIGWTPLHHAVENGLLELVQLLATNAENVNAKSSIGLTPLHLAAHYGHVGISELLIEKSGKVNAEEVTCWTPLHLAAQRGHLDIVKLLIRHFANVNAKERDDWTALHLAAQNGHPEVVKHLVDHAGNVNAKTNNHWTPLHLAAQNDHWEVVEILVKNRGKINVRNSSGWTSFHTAAQKGHMKILGTLMRNNSTMECLFTLPTILELLLSFYYLQGTTLLYAKSRSFFKCNRRTKRKILWLTVCVLMLLAGAFILYITIFN